MLTKVTTLLLLVAFLLLLLATLSAPIIDTIYLFRLSANARSSLFSGTGASGHVQFGVSGYCLSRIEASVLGFGKSLDSTCTSPPRIGYSLDERVSDALNLEDLNDYLSGATTGVLALYPTATVFTFIALLASLWMIRADRGIKRQGISTPESRRSFRTASWVTCIFALLGALAATIAFFAPIAIVTIARQRLDSDSPFNVDYGNAVWMTLVAFILLWASVVMTLRGVCSCGPCSRKRVY